MPTDSDSVQSAVFKSLFDRAVDVRQLSLLDLLQEEALLSVNQSWERAVEREKVNRTRFAQRSIKPEQVEQELIETKAILGSEKDIERFVVGALQRLNYPLVNKKDRWLSASLPAFLGTGIEEKQRAISFINPAPEGVEYVGRNHPLVAGLGRYLFESALIDKNDNPASRCGVTVTSMVTKPTILLLLRVRYLLEGKTQLLAEECLARAFTGKLSAPRWLTEEECDRLFSCHPERDLSPANKRERLERILGDLGSLEPALRGIADERALVLRDSHQRVRALTRSGSVKVRPQLPMDILGVYLFLPV